MEMLEATIIRSGLGFGEAPRWHEGRLWYSDFYRRAVYSMAADGSDERVELEVPTQPSGLGWLPDGSLLVVSMTDHKVLRYRDGTFSEHADISEYCGFWANDMVVSSSGFAYVGNFGFDLDTMILEIGVAGMINSPPPPTTKLVVIDPSGSVVQVITDMAFPNGAVITPDGSTLIVAETLTYRLTAFDIASDGTLSNRRTFAQFDFVPADGICLDAEGQVWVANALSPECIRVAEGGEITQHVITGYTVFACMLGGDDRRNLYIMTAMSSNRFEMDGKTDGYIEMVRVDVPGAGLP